MRIAQRDTIRQRGGVEGGSPAHDVRMYVLRRDPGVEARDAHLGGIGMLA